MLLLKGVVFVPEQLDRKNILAMKLLHYFITEKNYNPIILQGAQDEIWLENMDSEYKIVRIVSNHIINDEQYNFDIFKTKHIMRKIKRKTFSFSMNALSIFTDIDEDIKFENTKNIDCVSIYDEKDLKKYKFISEKFPDIDKKLNFNEDGFQLFMKITADINKKNREDAIKVDEVFKRKTPIVTTCLIFVNVLMFILMYVLNYELYFIENYSVYGPSVVNDLQIYRLLTGTFLHDGIFHILVNMYSLYILGSQMEGFLGRTKFLTVYLFSSIVGSLFSIIFNTIPSVGASGAIFGLLGSLIYFGYHYRVYLGTVIKTQIIPIVLIELLIGFMPGSGIDNFAHIGGLVGGVLMTMALGVKYKSTKVEKINGWIVSIILVAFLCFIAFNYVNYS